MIGDGQLHPLSGRVVALAAAQTVYPFATSLKEQLDWAGNLEWRVPALLAALTQPASALLRLVNGHR